MLVFQSDITLQERSGQLQSVWRKFSLITCIHVESTVQFLSEFTGRGTDLVTHRLRRLLHPQAIWAKVSTSKTTRYYDSLFTLVTLVHGSLARAGKVKSQTPKVEAQEKKKTPKGRAKKRIIYNRR